MIEQLSLEPLLPTSNPKINIARTGTALGGAINEAVPRLTELAADGEMAGIRALLGEIVGASWSQDVIQGGVLGGGWRVDLTRIGRLIKARWWVLVLVAALGAIPAVVITSRRNDAIQPVFQASQTITFTQDEEDRTGEGLSSAVEAAQARCGGGQREEPRPPW